MSKGAHSMTSFARVLEVAEGLWRIGDGHATCARNDLVMTRLEEARRLVRDLQPIQPGLGCCDGLGRRSRARGGERVGDSRHAEQLGLATTFWPRNLSRASARAGPPRRGHRLHGIIRGMPPIDELTRIEPVSCRALDKHGHLHHRPAARGLRDADPAPDARRPGRGRHDRRPDVARRGADAQPRELRAG